MKNPSYINEGKDFLILRLHIQPNASKNEIAGIHGDRLKVRIKSPPVDGKANRALILFLSSVMEIKKNRIEIVRGEKGRKKDLKIQGISIKGVTERIFPT